MDNPTDMPERKWTGRTLGSMAGHGSFFVIASMLGRAYAEIFLAPVALFYYLFVKRSHAGSADLFARVFGTIEWWKRWAYGFKRVHAFAGTLCDRIYLHVRGATYFTVDFPGTRLVLDALRCGKGAIILSAHIGMWEVISRSFPRLAANVSVVVYEAERSGIRRLYARKSRESGVPFTLIHLNDTLDAIIRIRNALKRNEIVVMHGDRTMGAGRVIDFLGCPACFTLFPYSIAAKTGAPIITAFCLRLGQRQYRAQVFPHFHVPDDSPESISGGLRRYITHLEEIVRTYPFQWYNFYPFWETAHAT